MSKAAKIIKAWPKPWIRRIIPTNVLIIKGDIFFVPYFSHAKALRIKYNMVFNHIYPLLRQEFQYKIKNTKHKNNPDKKSIPHTLVEIKL